MAVPRPAKTVGAPSQFSVNHGESRCNPVHSAVQFGADRLSCVLSARARRERTSEVKGLNDILQMETTMNSSNFEHRRRVGSGLADGSADRDLRPKRPWQHSPRDRECPSGWRRVAVAVVEAARALAVRRWTVEASPWLAVEAGAAVAAGAVIGHRSSRRLPSRRNHRRNLRLQLLRAELLRVLWAELLRRSVLR